MGWYWITFNVRPHFGAWNPTRNRIFYANSKNNPGHFRVYNSGTARNCLHHDQNFISSSRNEISIFISTLVEMRIQTPYSILFENQISIPSINESDNTTLSPSHWIARTFLRGYRYASAWCSSRIFQAWGALAKENLASGRCTRSTSYSHKSEKWCDKNPTLLKLSYREGLAALGKLGCTFRKTNAFIEIKSCTPKGHLVVNERSPLSRKIWREYSQLPPLHATDRYYVDLREESIWEPKKRAENSNQSTWIKQTLRLLLVSCWHFLFVHRFYLQIWFLHFNGNQRYFRVHSLSWWTNLNSGF